MTIERNLMNFFAQNSLNFYVDSFIAGDWMSREICHAFAWKPNSGVNQKKTELCSPLFISYISLYILK